MNCFICLPTNATLLNLNMEESERISVNKDEHETEDINKQRPHGEEAMWKTFYEKTQEEGAINLSKSNLRFVFIFRGEK